MGASGLATALAIGLPSLVPALSLAETPLDERRTVETVRSLPSEEAGGRTLRFEIMHCGVYEYDLGTSEVSGGELRRLFELVGPDVGSRRRVLPQLRRCIDESPEYWPCGERRPSSPHFFRNARVNLRRAERLIGQIRAIEHPELREPKRYLLTQYETWRSIMERKRRVLEGASLDLLLEPVGGLPIRERCRRSVAGLGRLQESPDELLESLKGWHNCVNHLMQDLGHVRRGYPRAAWERFLEAHGIEERLFTEEDCDPGIETRSEPGGSEPRARAARPEPVVPRAASGVSRGAR